MYLFCNFIGENKLTYCQTLVLRKIGSYERTIVNQLVQTTFSKITDKIFIKFQIKFWFLEDKQVTQPGKRFGEKA